MMTKTTSFTAGSHVFGLKRLNTAKGIVETEKEKRKQVLAGINIDVSQERYDKETERERQKDRQKDRQKE